LKIVFRVGHIRTSGSKVLGVKTTIEVA
jgi:hypothetical protein